MSIRRPRARSGACRKVRLALAACAAVASVACVRDGLAGFACTAAGACDDGLECHPLPRRSLLNGRDRDVCLRPARPAFFLRATTAPCCTEMYLGVDAAGVLKIAAPSEQPPLEFRLTNVGDDVVLNTEALDDFGELWPFSLCVVDGDGSGRVTLCDLLSEEEEDETTTRTPRAARWQEIVPALDDDEGHVSFRSVANDGFIRHSVFEVFAQADTGPPFTADASWIAEQSPAATTE